MVRARSLPNRSKVRRGFRASPPAPEENSEQAREHVQEARFEYREQVSEVEPRRLVFLDETGTHVAMTRACAWAPVGQRAHDIVIRNRGRVLTVLGAIALDGVRAMMTVEGGTTRALRVSLAARRSVRLEGNGFAVSRALEAALLPTGDPRCGVVCRRFEYGGSVPGGWTDERTLVLPDALVETTDDDVESSTFVSIRASTEARADELARLATDVPDRLAPR
jgi:hypothetical protein